MIEATGQQPLWAPDAEWWKRAVIYQIYPRSFCDSTGNGIGDLRGVVERLDHLAQLRVDAIWLSPFYPSPMHDFGYDVSDYTGVDPLFGSLDDFDRLVEAAHRRGIGIILDWVPNHTSIEHPWFRESRSSRDSPLRDWYVWADALDGGEPNNWQSVFGGPAWTLEVTTGQYYLHSFLPEQPDLNWRNPTVRRAMFETVQFWLDRGVDGIRIDVAHYLMKDPQLRDNPPARTAPTMFKGLGEYDAYEHLYDKGHPDIHSAFRALRSLLEASGSHVVSIGEIHEWDLDRWASYYGDGDELHMPFNFTLLYTPWTAEAVRERVEAIERAVPWHGWPNYVLGNHDEPRLASRLGAGRARVAAMLLLTLRGTPTIYYGDELGMADVEIPPGREQDP